MGGEGTRSHGSAAFEGGQRGELAHAQAVVSALLAQAARFVDLDGPLLLAGDRKPGLRYDGSLIYPPEPGLWG